MIIPFFLLCLSLIGLLDTAYLSYTHLFGSAACGSGSGCDRVLTSAYADIGGLPLSVMGLGFYAALALMAWRAQETENRDAAVRAVSLGALAGVPPTLFLLYVQAAIVEAWCPFCLTSAALVFLLLLLSFADRRRRENLRPLVGRLPTAGAAFPVFLAFSLPPLVFVPLQAGVQEAVLEAQSPPVEIVAHIGERAVSLAEMDAGIRWRLQKVKDEMRAEWLDRQVLEAEAGKQGMEVRDLVEREVQAQVSQEEVDRRWEAIKGRLGPNATKESVESGLRRELGQRKRNAALGAYVAKLREEHGAHLQPPASERIATAANPDGSPQRGAAAAPVTIVAFSDLECSYCAHSHRSLEELVERRPGDVRFVYRHFPLEHIHQHARYAAEVAAAAQEQGKFWPLATLLFAHQRDLQPEQVRRLAAQAGVDTTRLEEQLAAGKRRVAADIAAGEALGITSTPTFFVNGHYVNSLPTGDGLDRLVDRALETAGRSAGR